MRLLVDERYSRVPWLVRATGHQVTRVPGEVRKADRQAEGESRQTGVELVEALVRLLHLDVSVWSKNENVMTLNSLDVDTAVQGQVMRRCLHEVTNYFQKGVG